MSKFVWFNVIEENPIRVEVTMEQAFIINHSGLNIEGSLEEGYIYNLKMFDLLFPQHSTTRKITRELLDAWIQNK